MLKDDTKERIKNWSKTIIKDIMEFYSCDETRAWAILAADNYWKVAMIAEKIDRGVQDAHEDAHETRSATEKIDTGVNKIQRMKEEERKRRDGLIATLIAIWAWFKNSLSHAAEEAKKIRIE